MHSQGQLAEHFVGVGVKRLASVDTKSSGSSNQHEVNGSKAFMNLLGSTPRVKGRSGDEDTRLRAKYMLLNDDGEPFVEAGYLSWYDTRKNQTHRGPEWRLYYQGNTVTSAMREGDTLFIALHSDGTLLFIVAAGGSTAENQLSWLFGFGSKITADFAIKPIERVDEEGPNLAAKLILDEIGVDYIESSSALERFIKRFGLVFPKTSVMSALARESLVGADCLADPDSALVSWLEREEALFRLLERKIVSTRLKTGFYDGKTVDVDGFISFSMSVQNRRKARMGQSLEHHLEHIFRSHGVSHARGAKTENNAKPDFLFPSRENYLDIGFDASQLFMLGAKSTCKDRWRQVLSEAKRITSKHLLTLEPSISKNQTDEMQSSHLQLVVPTAIQSSYSVEQQEWLMNLADFIGLVRR